MGSTGGCSDDERSVIGEKGELPFMDFQEDKSVCSYIQKGDDPVVVSVPFPFVNGVPRSVVVGQLAKDSITIKNNTDESVDIWSISIYASEPENSFMLSVMDPSPSESDSSSAKEFFGTFCLEDRVLQPEQSLTVWLSCKPKSIGSYKTAVHIDLNDERIERVAILLVDNKISQSLASNRPYSRVVKKKRYEVDSSYVRGTRPARPEGRSFRKRLPVYPIPMEIREMVANKQIPDAIRGGLTKENYVSFFHTLLNLEELQLEEDMRNFDMELISMRRRGSQCLTLEVPGLAERRPSLVSGDSVFVKLDADDSNDSKYEGVVHRVEADEIYLKFAKEFHNRHRDENLYNVRFTYNRTNMRKCYAAIEAAKSLEKTLLFPSELTNKRRIRTTPLVPISCMLNEEQMCAIEMILGCHGIPPYVIHGPPGTGKTMTIVEAILQLYRSRRNVRILVCTPSNSAADHILEKILSETPVEFKEGEVFRLNASSRSHEEVKPEIMPFCFFDEVELAFKCPALHALQRYRIIVSTYMSASNLYAEGVERGHFSHIFLDEAGQASEPDAMIPLSNLCQRETVVVLAGDPMQLGPIVYSKKAGTFGLGKSYLERLFESEFYSCGDENYVTKLVRNYRCHPEILHLPSQLFYQGELKACRDDTSYLTGLEDFLLNNEFPILFMGIQGCDEREGNNPSWFNRIEASKVVEVIETLTGSGKISEQDIGIITPYRQQVLKLKKAFEDLDMLNIKIGSVEQFQGQEKHVMVVSTVRSTVKHNEFDRVHCLGFLSNPRRFNVAVTRAISLLVIVGNPHIICKDPYWNKLLWHCVDNSSYQGCALPERNELDINELAHRANREERRSQFHGESNYRQGNTNLDDGNRYDWGQGNSQFNDGNCNDRGQENSQFNDGNCNDRGQENSQFDDGNNWCQNYSQQDIPVPVTDEAEWSDWCQNYSQQDIPVPVTDEAEWSDGWK